MRCVVAGGMVHISVNLALVGDRVEEGQLFSAILSVRTEAVHPVAMLLVDAMAAADSASTLPWLSISPRIKHVPVVSWRLKWLVGRLDGKSSPHSLALAGDPFLVSPFSSPSMFRKGKFPSRRQIGCISVPGSRVGGLEMGRTIAAPRSAPISCLS